MLVEPCLNKSHLSRRRPGDQRESRNQAGRCANRPLDPGRGGRSLRSSIREARYSASALARHGMRLQRRRLRPPGTESRGSLQLLQPEVLPQDHANARGPNHPETTSHPLQEDSAPRRQARELSFGTGQTRKCRVHNGFWHRIGPKEPKSYRNQKSDWHPKVCECQWPSRSR